VRLFLIALCCSLAAGAEERWIDVKSGPFQVFSEAGDKPARETLNELEQFRQALGETLGQSDLKLLWPMRVLVYKKQPPAPAGSIALGRDAYMLALVDRTPMAPETRKQLARLLINENTNRLPAGIEEGLVELFSTLEVSGTHITLGAPVPPAERSRDWARMHLLTVDPAYSGRTRVFLSNLAQSPDMDAACRNAFEKKPAQIETQLDGYIKAGAFGTADVSGRALSAARDFRAMPVDRATIALAQADLLFAFKKYDQAQSAYSTLHGAEAAEGLGLIAAAQGNKAEAKRLLASAVDSASKNARAYFELAALEPEPAKARPNLHKAAGLNPLWAEPWARLAALDENPAQKIADWKKAAALAPRQIEYWQELAQAAARANQFSDAAKAWAGALRAASNDGEREQIRAKRLAVEQERADFEMAERKRQQEAEAADLKRVQDQSMAEIHAAEAAANRKLNPNGEQVPAPQMWIEESNGSAHLEGTLERFECLGARSRLVIKTADGAAAKLSVHDTARLALAGGDVTSIACGPQKTPRRVSVTYIAQPNAKLGTLGEATIVEFR